MRTVAISLIAAFSVSCASTTMIKSVPSGAKVYIDGSLAGKTPYTYSDTKIVGSTTMIKLKKEGCEDWSGVMTRSETFQIGPCIGGALVLVPFLWVMGYNPSRTYELECKDQANSPYAPSQTLSATLNSDQNFACVQPASPSYKFGG